MEGRGGEGRAFLVGSPGTNLQGIDFDVNAMAELLRNRGFSVELCVGAGATRDGILAGYDRLIARVQRDEPAVFYYAGHGFFGYRDTEPTRSWQGIYPADRDATTTDDFRGITAWELSIKQAQLTARTRNVTTILDCCYASQMSRAAAAQGAVARALPHPFRNGFAAHLEALHAMYPDAYGTVGATGNPDAVRLVACGPSECAYEYLGDDGVYRGAFTEALVAVLREVDGAPVSWAAIHPSIQARVTRQFSIQHPGIEGPRRRRLFSLNEDTDDAAVAILALDDGFRLFAGRVMGVALGDVYGVMPSGSPSYQPTGAIANVEVREVSGTLSTAILRAWNTGHSALPPGAVAFAIEKRAVRHAIAIDVPADARAEIAREVSATSNLRLAGPGELVVLPTLRLHDTAITLEDRIGPLFPPARFPDDLHAMVQNLANLGAAQDLRELEGEHGVGADEIEVELAAVDRGQLRRMPDSGSALALRDKLSVRIVSRSQRTLYVHLFNIGLRGRIRSLTRDVHTGFRLTSERPEFVLGQTPEGAVIGCDLSWPPGMPRDTPRTDEIVVIATTMVTSLQGLETIEQPIGERSAPGSQMFDGFLVRRLTYLLHPRDAVAADLPFMIDDNPLRQGAARSSEAWNIRPGVDDESRSAEVTVRLVDFVLKSPAVVSGSVRLDMLITTRAGGDVRTAAWTRRPRGASAGTPLDLGDGIAFCGPVCDFVELHLWISGDAGGPDLTQLLAHWQDDHPLSRAGDPPAAATTASAAGAAAVVARAAYGALREADGGVIGVYRTCLVADESFGGSRPSIAAFETSDLAFTTSITAARRRLLDTQDTGYSQAVRPSRRWNRRVVYAALAAFALGALAIVAVTRWPRELDCKTASRTVSAGMTVEICQREYERTNLPLIGTFLADALRRAGNLAAAQAIAGGLLTTEAQADALQILGKIAAEENRTDDAIQSYQDARRLHREQGDHRELARDDQALAALQETRNDYSDALQTLVEAISEAHTADDAPTETFTHFMAARVLMDVGYFEAAGQELDLAGQLATSDHELARLWFDRGNLDQELLRGPPGVAHNNRAVMEFRRSLEIAERLRDASLALAIHLNLAYSLAETGKLDEAETQLSDAGVLDRDGKHELDRQELAALIAYRRGDLALAFSLNERAYPKIDEADERIEVCVMQGRIALATHDLAQAEQWAERGVKTAKEVRSKQPISGLRSWVLSSRRRPFEVLFTALLRAGRLEEAVGVFDQWQGRTLLDEMARPSPDPSPGLSSTAADIQSLGRWLPEVSNAPLMTDDSDAVLQTLQSIDLVAFAVIANEYETQEIWRLTASHGRLRFDKLGSIDEFRDRLARFTATPTAPALASELGALLIPQEMARTTDDPLYVVLDAPLAKLPFVALRRADQPMIAWRPVIRSPRFPVTSPCEPQAASSGALVLADAKGDLPGARRESGKVASLFGTAPLVGAAATSPALFAAKPVRLLHIAVHAGFDAGGGVLVLSDRSVSAAEISARKLGPDLVVLSACSTASSDDPELAGALSTAFLAGGSSHVIATLRPIDDTGALEVTSRFYDAHGADDPVGVLAKVQAALATTTNTEWPNYAVFSKGVCSPGAWRRNISE